MPGSYFGSEIFNDFRRVLDTWAATDPGQLTYFGGESLVTQSHGQSVMAYFRSRYKMEGIYFLDEPETVLSPRIYSFDPSTVDTIGYRDTQHYQLCKSFLMER